MLALKLDRPLVFFDLESTGTNPETDRIVELSILRVDQDGSSHETTRRINPTIPIPPGATAVHHITDEDVAQCPTFDVIAPNLFHYLGNCDLGGYNLLQFDIPLLVAEFKRAGLDFDMNGRRVVDVFNIFRKLFPRNLSAAYRFFCGKTLEGAHGAAADTLATFEVFEAQLEKYPELPRDLDAIHAYCDMTDPDALDKTRRFKWNGTEVMVNFGKYSGRMLRDIAENEPGFLRWIIRADFAEDVKKIARDALSGIFPERPAQDK